MNFIEKLWSLYIAEQARKRDYNLEVAERQKQHELDLKVCHSCEALQQELVRASHRESELLALLKPAQSTEDDKPFESKFSELKPKNKPWSVKRQELEARDRNSFKKEVTVDSLDDELIEVRENATRS